jgi:hypothetical protein
MLSAADMEVIERFLRGACAVGGEGAGGAGGGKVESAAAGVGGAAATSLLFDEFEDMISDPRSRAPAAEVVMSKEAMDELAVEFRELLQFVGTFSTSKKM